MERSRPAGHISYKDIQLLLWIAITIWILAYIGISFLDIPVKDKEFMRNVTYTGGVLLAISGTLLAGLQVKTRERRLWLTLSAAIAIWSVADYYIGFQQLFTGLKGNPRPTIADFLYVLAYILFVLVVYYFVRVKKPGAARKAKIDIQYVIVWTGLFTASLIIAWGMILNPIYQSFAGSEKIGMLEEIYPILDIAIIVSLAGKYFKESPAFWDRSETLIVVGLSIFMVSDIVYHFLAITGMYRVQNLPANLVCIIGCLAHFTIFMAALYKVAWDKHGRSSYSSALYEKADI